MNRLQFFRNIFFALAAFIWLPASAHCELENIPGLEFLHCGGASQSANSPCQDCDDCSVENAQYKSDSQPLTLCAPNWLPLETAPLQDLKPGQPVLADLKIFTVGRPEFFNARHFVSRTALPARAPSLAS